jgi:hypothetical protein
VRTDNEVEQLHTSISLSFVKIQFRQVEGEVATGAAVVSISTGTTEGMVKGKGEVHMCKC